MQIDNHTLCIIDVITELMKRNFACYLEYEVEIEGRRKAVIDILAIRKEQKVIFEIGYLSQNHKGERLRLLHSLMPKAKIIHVTQMKNFIPSRDFDEAKFQYIMKKWSWYHDKKLYESIITGIDEIVDIKKMGESLARKK